MPRLPPDAALLVPAWLRARSLVRGLPPPQPDRGGLRVDVNSPLETRRYVFTRPGPGLRELAERISEPRVFLKLCGAAEELEAQVTGRWRLEPPRHVMARFHPQDAPDPLPAGYRLQVRSRDGITGARLLTEQDEIAASGFAGETDEVFIFDRIVTAEAHRRRGLGRQIMGALTRSLVDPRKPQVLVATDEGRALYAALGWTRLSDYATAVIP